MPERYRPVLRLLVRRCQPWDQPLMTNDERNSMAARPNIDRINARIAAGEDVTQTDVALAIAADVNRVDLDRLAESLTARTGIAHHVYRTRQGDLAVYSENYAALGLGLVRADA